MRVSKWAKLQYRSGPIQSSEISKYVTLSIPESVVLRVHLRLTQQTLQTSLAARNPLRVIKLRNSNTAVAKQPRHITDLKSLQKPANRAGVAEPVRTAVGDTRSEEHTSELQ